METTSQILESVIPRFLESKSLGCVCTSLTFACSSRWQQPQSCPSSLLLFHPDLVVDVFPERCQQHPINPSHPSPCLIPSTLRYLPLLTQLRQVGNVCFSCVGVALVCDEFGACIVDGAGPRTSSSAHSSFLPLPPPHPPPPPSPPPLLLLLLLLFV